MIDPFAWPTQGRSAAILTPNQVSGLVLWLDASRRDSLTVDGSNRVSAWADLSGEGNTVSQGTEANMPTLAAAAVNGRDALLFDDDAAQQLDLGSALLTAAPMSVLAVVNTDDDSSPHLGAVFSIGSGLPAQDFEWALFFYGTGDDYYWQARENPTFGTAQSTGTHAAGSARVVSAVESASNSRSVWVDGGSSATDTTDTDPNASANLAETSVGARVTSGNTVFWSGHICELLVFSTALSTAQRTALEQYLATKWGVTLA